MTDQVLLVQFEITEYVSKLRGKFDLQLIDKFMDKYYDIGSFLAMLGHYLDAS